MTPTEHQVNRINQTPGLDRDLKDIESAENEGMAPEQKQVFIDKFVKATEGFPYLKADPTVTGGEPTPRAVIDAVVNQAAIDLGAAHPRGLTRDPDLALFRKQVIDAFRHMGLDVKKFF